MSSPTRPKRSIRFSDEEWVKARKNADNVDMSRAAFIRLRATESGEHPEQDGLLALISHDLRECVTTLAEIRGRIEPPGRRDDGEPIDLSGLDDVSDYFRRLTRAIAEHVDGVTKDDLPTFPEKFPPFHMTKTGYLIRHGNRSSGGDASESGGEQEQPFSEEER